MLSMGSQALLLLVFNIYFCNLLLIEKYEPFSWRWYHTLFSNNGAGVYGCAYL